MDITLRFHIGHSSSAKIAKFGSIEQKEEYVEAECKDSTCQNKFFDYQAARTLEQRREARDQLGIARWVFYQNWLKKKRRN